MIFKILARFEKFFARLLGKGYGCGDLEQEVAQAFKVLKTDNINLCIDIGGNKGLYSQEILNKSPLTQIIIFEPAKINIDALNKKFRDNRAIKIEPFAVSNRAEKSELYSNEYGSGLASLTKRNLDHYDIDFEQVETIETIIFEDYWKNHLNKQKIDLCKIDIEGHEMDALNGFGEAINHMNVIQFEFGGCNIDTRTYFRDFWYFFKDKKFNIYRITPLGLLEISHYREIEENFTTMNYLAKNTSM